MACLDADRIRADLSHLASAPLEGRLAGTPGNEAATAYVEARFGELGLAPAGDSGYRQAFGLTAHVLSSPPALSLGGVRLEPGVDFVPIEFSGSGEVSGPIVFSGYGITLPPYDPVAYPRCRLPAAGYDDYATVDVRGRVALILRHAPDEDLAVGADCPALPGTCAAPPCHTSAWQKIGNAARNGASALLFVQDYRHPGEAIRGFSTGLEAFRAHPLLPVLVVSRARAEAVFPDLASRASRIDAELRPASVESAVEAALLVSGRVEARSAANVLGAIPGADPARAGEVVVIGAHVDHLGVDPYSGRVHAGADDNASGTAILLELARALSSRRDRVRRTVLFAAWNAEEAGLLGSCHYVSSPTHSITGTVAVFSIDMVGAGDGTGLTLHGATLPSNGWLATLMNEAAAARGLGVSAVAALPRLTSDHACFAKVGVPALLAESRGPHPAYHTPGDTLSSISDAALESSARLLWVALASLAAGEGADESRGTYSASEMPKHGLRDAVSGAPRRLPENLAIRR